MRYLLFVFIFFSGLGLFAQSERVASTSTLNPVKCPTLSARPAEDLCTAPTATISPSVQIPPGATIAYSWGVPAGANIIGGTNNLQLVTSTGGVYSLSASNSTTGCTDYKTYTVIACPVGIKENSANVVIASVYPNPFHNVLEVSVQKQASVSVFDMYGCLHTTMPLEAGTTRVDLSALATGLYYLEIKNDTQRQTVKVLKD